MHRGEFVQYGATSRAGRVLEYNRHPPIDEIKTIRDKAEALRAYAKQAGESLDMQNQCAEIKIRAERRAGELIPEQGRKQGERDETYHDETFEKPKLEDLDISRDQSSRRHKIT